MPDFFLLGLNSMFRNIFNLKSSSKRLILIMVIISFISLIIAYFYYDSLNKADDPRVRHIDKFYKNYQKYVRENDFYNVLAVLDSIEYEYNRIEHYRDSYEIGVIYTNKAAVYVTMALYDTQDEQEKAGFLIIAEELLNKSLEYFNKWESKYKGLNRIEIQEIVAEEFSNIGNNKEKIIKKRTDEIELAVSEINRRLSVAYTNIGIVKRHQMKQQEAIEYYKKAIELWDDNYSAKSNLNVLLGGEPIKRSFLQKLFPPKKK